MQENFEWGIAASVITLVIKYFFDRWNKKADELPSKSHNDDDSLVDVRECRHNRNNCTNMVNLQVQQLTMQIEQMKGELQTIRGILLVVATQGGIPAERLTELTK